MNLEDIASNVKLKFVLNFPNFLKSIKISEKRNPIYYFWNGVTITSKKGKIPNTYLKNTQLVLSNNGNVFIEALKSGFAIGKFFNNNLLELIKKTEDLPDSYTIRNLDKKYKFILCKEIEKGIYEKIIKNKRSLDKPRFQSIRGNDIFWGKLHPSLIDKIIKSIKAYYNDCLEESDIKPIDSRLHIHFYFKEQVLENQELDVDNKTLVYYKPFQDLLLTKKIIKSDSYKYIPSFSSFLEPVQNEEDRHLTIYIYEYKE